MPSFLFSICNSPIFTLIKYLRVNSTKTSAQLRPAATKHLGILRNESKVDTLRYFTSKGVRRLNKQAWFDLRKLRNSFLCFRVERSKRVNSKWAELEVVLGQKHPFLKLEHHFREVKLIAVEDNTKLWVSRKLLILFCRLTVFAGDQTCFLYWLARDRLSSSKIFCTLQPKAI